MCVLKGGGLIRDHCSNTRTRVLYFTADILSQTSAQVHIREFACFLRRVNKFFSMDQNLAAAAAAARCFMCTGAVFKLDCY